MQLLYEENLKSLKTIQIESEKLQKKNDVRVHFPPYTLFESFFSS